MFVFNTYLISHVVPNYWNSWMVSHFHVRFLKSKGVFINSPPIVLPDI